MILIVSHDAGGAAILASWVKQNRDKHQFLTCLAGPAVDIFAERGFRIKNIVLSDCFKTGQFENIDFILTGTSGRSCLERKAIEQAKKRKIKCACFLDHWVNYQQRFLSAFKSRSHQDQLLKSKKWLDYLPDEIWVGDRFAWQLALDKGFPKSKLKLVLNPYFRELRGDRIGISRKGNLVEAGKDAKQSKIFQKTILYVASLLDDAWGKSFGETDICDVVVASEIGALISALKKHKQKVASVIIRPHPADRRNPSSYDEIINRQKSGVKLIRSANTNIIDDIKRADIVVGEESMALVVAMHMNKMAFTVLPDKAKAIIPYKEIIRLKSIKQISDYL